MSKPALRTSKEKRLIEAKNELDMERNTVGKMKQTTVMLEEDLLYSIKEIALQRKKAGIEPSSLAGMIREALTNIVEGEGKK